MTACRAFLLLAVVLAGLGRISAAPAPDVEPVPPFPHEAPGRSTAVAPRAGEPIDDRATAEFLRVEGRKLVQAGKTLRDWKDGLSRTSCRLELPPPGRGKLTPAEIARRTEDAVAVVGTFYLCPKCHELHVATASGFFLNRSGALATSRHVLASYNGNGRGVVVLTRGGRLCAVRAVLAADAPNDVVVLQVDGDGFTPVPLSAEAPVGAPVVVISHPAEHFYMLTTGVVARHSVRATPDGPVRTLGITADFANGSSGAPVLNENGAAVGVVTSTESIYYNRSSGGGGENLQMVLKNCTPSQALRKLITAP